MEQAEGPVQPGEELARLLEEAVDLARRAGEVTLGYFRSSGLAVEHKADGTPVTQADRQAERLIRSELEKRHPADGIVGEEEGVKLGESGRRWFVDPIDGTIAFTRGVGTYTNLLALEDEQGIAIGVINVPALGETVYAARGLGCYWNGAPAHVSDCDQLAESYPHHERVRQLDRLRPAGPQTGRARSFVPGPTASATPWSPQEELTR